MKKEFYWLVGVKFFADPQNMDKVKRQVKYLLPWTKNEADNVNQLDLLMKHNLWNLSSSEARKILGVDSLLGAFGAMQVSVKAHPDVETFLFHSDIEWTEDDLETYVLHAPLKDLEKAKVRI